MNKNIILGISLLMVIVGGLVGVKYYTDSNKDKSVNNAYVVGSNAINIEEQNVSSIAKVSMLQLAKKGFVAIYRSDEKGMPVSILGYSEILDAGSHNDLEIQLNEEMIVGDRYMAVIHADNGDGALDISKDLPAIDSLSNGPVMMFFNVGRGSASGVISL